MKLIGTWIVDHSDSGALAELGNVMLEFHNGGELNYIIRAHDRDQIINMQYLIDGDVIVTDQPSAPNVERTAFSLTDDGVLTLNFEGISYRFKRA